MREGAIRLLGRIRPGDSRAVEACTKALQDAEVAVRWGAVRALGDLARTGRIDAVQLASRLRDEFWYVRRTAATTLAKVGPSARAAVPALEEALAGADQDLEDRIRAAIRAIASGHPSGNRTRVGPVVGPAASPGHAVPLDASAYVRGPLPMMECHLRDHFPAHVGIDMGPAPGFSGLMNWGDVVPTFCADMPGCRMLPEGAFVPCLTTEDREREIAALIAKSAYQSDAVAQEMLEVASGEWCGGDAEKSMLMRIVFDKEAGVPVGRGRFIWSSGSHEFALVPPDYEWAGGDGIYLLQNSDGERHLNYGWTLKLTASGLNLNGGGGKDVMLTAACHSGWGTP